jgi:ankyrin repeat protein
VKDQIVDALQTIAENETDPRRPRALYELAICSLTNFGYPSTGLKRFTWPPAESGLPTHLDYLVKAAELGERAAKAVVKRIFETEPTFDSPPQTIEWLRDAAANGYVIALEDLAEGNYDLYRLAIMSKVERMYDKELSMDPSETFSQRVTAYLEKDSNDFIERDINSRGDTFLHWAVACGHVGWVRTFITEYNMDINLRNHDGDTPLLLGCKNDQYETVKCLLSFSSCDVHSRTKLGESALHFAWCFAKKDEAAAVVRELASRGIDFQLPAEEAAGHGESRVIAPRVTHLDPLPVLPGLAIERVVARNRTDLFRLFLELGAKVTPCNGAVTRRMLLWATRLGHHEMLHLIYEFAQGGRAGTQDPSLRPLADTTWEFEGTTLKLEHSLALGWVSGSGDGWDTPIEYWRKCCKGGKYLAALCSIIGNKAEFQQCDAALDWAFRRGHTDFVSALLECRFEDLCRIELPSWKCARQKYILWRDLIRLVSPSSATSPIPNPQSSIENPKAPIDEICYSSDGTLAQRAILKGDRGMFNLLVRGHGADMRSICFFPGDKGGTWGSAYYLILKAHHFDIWFA